MDTKVTSVPSEEQQVAGNNNTDNKTQSTETSPAETESTDKQDTERYISNYCLI